MRRGVCSAKGALRLRKKASVLQHRDLHAKIYLFDNVAIVGSANLSLDSSTKLVEAGVLLTGKEVASVRRETQRILRQSVRLEDNVLRQWARIEPKRKPLKGNPGPRKASNAKDLLLDGRTVWLVDCVPYEESAEESKAKKKKEKVISEERDITAATLEWFSACGRRVYRKVREGDWVVLWWMAGTRAAHGKLEGPFECLSPVDLGRGLRGARYALALVPRRRREVPLDAKRFAQMTRHMSTRRVNQEERTLLPAQAKAVARLLAQ